ncbi:MAG: BatD family protein [Woeseiaceae bacterium]|nr:BatD family protein [Woeseiaceae bacterium]
MVAASHAVASIRRAAYAAGILLLALGAAATADAAVVASVDRDRIDLNESFTLRVTVDTAIDAEPDAGALEEDFYVQQRSQLSNTTIVNGQITRSRTWSFVLMAKRSGDLVIPPVIIGNEQSEPVPIRVSPQSNTVPGEADIFVVTEADFEESYVQAQILYTVKVYRAVATRQPRLSEPDISGVDVLVEIAGEERSYDSILNDRNYQVNERVYAIFPQESGEIRIGPARFEARVLRNGRISGRKVFQSDPIVVDVKPIPSPPADHPDATWLPAKSVTLSEEWSREPDSLPAGEPITRRLTVTALGQLSTQIPVIDMRVSDSLKVYPDKPELRVNAEAGGILATRTDQYAMIGVQPGAVDIRPIELPWWDIAEGEWKIARLGGRSIDILPSADALPPQIAEPAAEAAAPAEPEVQPVDSPGSDFWRRVSEVLAGVWLLTLLAWWWSGKPKQKRENKPPSEPPLHRQQSRLLKDARRSAVAGDLQEVRRKVLEWGRLEWPDAPPRSVGDLADRVNEPAASELRVLARYSYGPTDADEWAGDALARSLKTMSARRHDKAPERIDELPPLMPG